MELVEHYSNVVEIEKGVRNPWHWHWLDEKCNRGKDLKTWCVKTKKPGSCYCTVCDLSIVYGSSGKKALHKHANGQDHIDRDRTLQTNTRLDSIPSCQSLQDGSAEVKAVLGLFLSQNCLPFSMGPKLLKLAQRLNKVKNKTALASASLSNTSATYTTTHGVARNIKTTIASRLEDKHISLNIDEATNASGNKILNVLAQYYCEEEGRVIIDLIGSRQENIATADNLMKALEDVLQQRGVSWDNIVSCLMDNCNVMRGKKGGVETKIREKNSNLMDISGDTVHTLNNAACKLFSILETKFFSFEAFCSDLFYDIEDSPKIRALFMDLQHVLNKTRKSILRHVPTRFLQIKTVAERIAELWPSLLVFYSVFVTANEKELGQKLRKEITDKLDLTEEQNQELHRVLAALKRHKPSEAGTARKGRLISAIIDNRTKLELMIQVHIGVLDMFQGFVKTFQTKKPMCHMLHTELFKVVKRFYSSFIQPQHIPEYSASELVSLNVSDKTLHVKNRHLTVGDPAYLILQKCLKDIKRHHWVTSFLEALKEGYIQCAEMMKKLPIDNKTIAKLAYLDPRNQRSDCTCSAFMSLAKQLPKVVKETELGALDSELRHFVVDDDVSIIDADSTDDNFRLDTSWWTPIFHLKTQNLPRYPVLTKLVKSLLSIFCGPVVEGTFNIMNDIIEEDRSRITPFNYEAVAMVKSYLDTRNLSAVDMEITKSMRKHVTGPYAAYSHHLQARSQQVTVSATPASLPPKSTPAITPKQTTLPPPAPNSMEQPASTQSPSQPSTSAPNQAASTSHTPSNNVPMKRKQQVTLSSFFSKKPRV